MEPKVLLMDEPLSNLDAKLREQMRTEIRRIQKQIGITSVYVTHDQVEAMTLSDRICIINKGKIEQVGTPVQIYQQPANPFVADFIGRANFLDAHVRAVADDLVTVDVLGHVFDVPKPLTPVTAGQDMQLLLRPEAVEFGAENGVHGVVRRAAYLGSVIDYDVEVGGTVISVLVYDPRRKALRQEGEEVSLGIIAEATYLLAK
jgi:iron(III) transport system ATP-binding protein